MIARVKRVGEREAGDRRLVDRDAIGRRNYITGLRNCHVATLRESTNQRVSDIWEVISHDFFPAVIGVEWSDLGDTFLCECKYTRAYATYEERLISVFVSAMKNEKLTNIIN